MSNEKINIEENIEENIKNTDEIEIPGAGQWGVPRDKADAAFDMIEGRYKHLVDDTYLSGFLAGLYFFIVPEDSETHGFDVGEYFENSLRMHNARKNGTKASGILSALLG
ncbi:hypothetical protein [Gordonibacter urolithinfaciens]|uniref:hypothetical protein n=1 Tax=Gordonibacter urolithinfaciens TaxID=1335613 RepID=UPI0034A9F8AE